MTIGHNVPKLLVQIGHNTCHNCLNHFSFVNDKIHAEINLRKITLNHFCSISFSFLQKLRILEFSNSCLKNYFKIIHFMNSHLQSPLFSYMKKSIPCFEMLKCRNEFFQRLNISFSENF